MSISIGIKSMLLIMTSVLRPTKPMRVKSPNHTFEGAHHVLQIRAMMASDEWETKCQSAVLSALGAVA